MSLQKTTLVFPVAMPENSGKDSITLQGGGVLALQQTKFMRALKFESCR